MDKSQPKSERVARRNCVGEPIRRGLERAVPFVAFPALVYLELKLSWCYVYLVVLSDRAQL